MKPSLVATAAQHLIDARFPFLLVGGPGVGKSDLVSQAAARAGADLIISHPAVEDPTVPAGMPWPDAATDTARFLPFGHLAAALRAKRPTVWFLDDLGQATPATQAAYMQLLLARRVGEHVLPDWITFAAATNRRGDRANVGGILEPVKSRFKTILNVEPDLPDWIAWALDHAIPTELIHFMKWRGHDYLASWAPSPEIANSPNPRTIANLGGLMALDLPAEVQPEMYGGAVGSTMAGEVIGFLKVMRDMVNPDLCLLQPDTAPIPTDPAVLWALTGALAAKASDQTVQRLVTYFNRLPDEFSVLAWRSAVAKCPAIVSTRAGIEWESKHSHVTL